MSKPVLTDAERSGFRAKIDCLSIFMDAAFLHQQSRKGDIDLKLFDATMLRLVEATAGDKGLHINADLALALAGHVGEARLRALLSEGGKGVVWMLRCDNARRATPDPFSELKTGE